MKLRQRYFVSFNHFLVKVEGKLDLRDVPDQKDGAKFVAIQHLAEEYSLCVATSTGDLLLWNLETLEVNFCHLGFFFFFTAQQGGYLGFVGFLSFVVCYKKSAKSLFEELCNILLEIGSFDILNLRNLWCLISAMVPFCVVVTKRCKHEKCNKIALLQLLHCCLLALTTCQLSNVSAFSRHRNWTQFVMQLLGGLVLLSILLNHQSLTNIKASKCFLC